MKDTRTAAQRFADTFDCDLYRLIGRAEQEAAIDKHWLKVVAALREARPLVRVKMSKSDREQTA